MTGKFIILLRNNIYLIITSLVLEYGKLHCFYYRLTKSRFITMTIFLIFKFVPFSSLGTLEITKLLTFLQMCFIILTICKNCKFALVCPDIFLYIIRIPHRQYLYVNKKITTFKDSTFMTAKGKPKEIQAMFIFEHLTPRSRPAQGTDHQLAKNEDKTMNI